MATGWATAVRTPAGTILFSPPELFVYPAVGSGGSSPADKAATTLI